jgi:hypothetical protein
VPRSKASPSSPRVEQLPDVSVAGRGSVTATAASAPGPMPRPGSGRCRAGRAP